MNYENLSPEQQERARACKNPEELAALAQEEGVELSDDMLDGIAGGGYCRNDHIPCVKDEHNHHPRH